MKNVYLEKLAEIAEDKGHTPRRPRSTAAGASSSVAAGAAIGLGAGHALNKVHDKAIANAEDIIRSKGADAIGNAGRAQKEHVAQALFRDAEILNAGADSVASKAGALSKLRGRLALGGAALGGAAYAAHRLTEKKAEEEAKKSQPVNTTHLALSLGAGAGVGTIAANTAAGIYSDKAYDSIAQRISLSKDKLGNKNAMNVAKHDAAGNEWFESKRLKNFADLDRWLGEDTNVKNPHNEKVRSAIHRHDRHMYKYQSIEKNMIDDVLKKERRILSSGLPAGIAVGATAYLLNAKKKSPEGWEHAKTAAWGIHAKDSYGDVLARTPGGIDDDYKRILSQSRELASRKPAVQVNSELESVYARIKAKGLENAHPDELVELSKLKAMPRVDSVKVLQDNNLKALEHVAMRGATPHSQWYSGTHPSKFKYLVGVNLENLKKVKRAARSVKL